MNPWFVYLLRLDHDLLYVGITQDLHRRLQEHHSGNGCYSTSTSRTIELIHTEVFTDRSSAASREAQLKRWSRAKKLALAENNLNDLQLLARNNR